MPLALRPRGLALNVLLGVLAVAVLIPYFYMFTGSFKPNSEIYALPIRLVPSGLYLDNFRQLLTEFPYVRWFVNSIVVTVPRILLTLLFCSMAGFALAKYDFKLNRPVLIVILVTLALPVEVLLIPRFILLAKLGWINTYWALIIPFAANSFGIFLMRQFMMSVPNELLDAARIDGASELTLFRRIAMPLAGPGLGVLGIVLFTQAWNDYLWPLIVLSKDEMYTLPVGIAGMIGPYHINYGTILAGSFLATLPVIAIFLFLQRQFIAGLTVGALKG